VIGKNVPGEAAALHRTANSDTQGANTREAVRTCKDVWGPYDGQQLNCDEYPFATTREGASNAGGNYSARLIDATDNQNAGRWLEFRDEEHHGYDPDFAVSPRHGNLQSNT
jgi:hypothetical protein